jgi:hypothetical protein
VLFSYVSRIEWVVFFVVFWFVLVLI